MSVLRWMAAGPWVTRDLKEAVLASDYDALRAEREIDRAIVEEARRNEVVALTERDEAVALLTEIAGRRAAVQFFAPHLSGVVAALARIDAFLAKIKESGK